uniref:Uncharacterized protein n=1 Tax=viral metagenome TaxID=1070528 RepID=A0A6C0C8K3_9ZZZZ
MTNNVYYQRDAKFVIIPNMNDIDTKKLLHHITQLKKMYTSDNSHSFFWKFDVKNNAIVVDETSASISSDVQEQLSLIAMWIFERGHHMKGQFILKINKLIKYFYMNGYQKSISNLELFDETDMKNITSENIIMYDAKNKIDSYINSELCQDKMNAMDLKIVQKAVTCEIDITWTEDDKEYRSFFSKKEICPSKQTLLSPFIFLRRNINALIMMITLSCLVQAYINDKYTKE